jgi:hypothetical protein
MQQAKQKIKNEPKYEARFKLNIDYSDTFKSLQSAGLNPAQVGGRPPLHGDSPGAQIRVEIHNPSVVALINNSKTQIYYKNNEDLPAAIWLLQPFIIEAETHKPVDNLATKLEYTSLTSRDIEDMRKTLMINDSKIMRQLEKNRFLTEILQSLISDLSSVKDAKFQSKIRPILKEATDKILKLNS